MAEATTIEGLFESGAVIFDGAMGTEIYRRDILTNRCYDELSLSEPNIIRDIHTSYCDAGADVLASNTYGANRVSLARFGLEDQVEAINTAAAGLARESADAADRRVFVAGSVGPLPRDMSHHTDPLTVLLEQVDALAARGVDFILFETQPTRDAMDTCARAMCERPELPFMLSCTVYSDCESAAGETIQHLFSHLGSELPRPIALGMNCGAGPDALLSAAEQALPLIDLPLVLSPNAGIPKEVDERRIYLCSPDYLAGFAKRFLDLGVRGIGGCCGTTPDHIREIAQRIKPLARGAAKTLKIEVAESVTPQEPTPFAEKSRLAKRLANKQWVATVELVPPRGCDLGPTIEKSRDLYARGVDAINIPDGPRASARVSPLVTSVKIQEEAQIEAILHFCARDRNLIGMQADLLACAACGLHNILFITGDPPKLGNYPFASGVFDTDSIGMCAVQQKLNQGIDIGGQAIDPKTNTVIGVGADPTALDQEREVRRFHEKVEAGAEFAITQPVFDIEALKRFLDRVQHLEIPIMAGIWPLASLRNATFLQNEIPGVIIPDAVMERMAAATDKDDQRKAGIEIARELVGRLRGDVAGIQVSAPFGNIQTALAVIQS